MKLSDTSMVNALAAWERTVREWKITTVQSRGNGVGFTLMRTSSRPTTPDEIAEGYTVFTGPYGEREATLALREKVIEAVAEAIERNRA